ERLEDMVHATSTAFLGVTVKCARCHDHKFDPITQVDYHRMAAAFWTGYLQPGQGVLGGPDEKALGFPVFGWTDSSADPLPLRLLKKGDPHRPMEPIPAEPMSFLPALATRHLAGPATVPASASAPRTTTQRRLRLARWIADPANPLTARVWVNRLWQHHFGHGLVRSPDNFGFNGDPPTHPELLDWLASELMRNGWRSKPIHRLMVLSQTYQQSSVHPDQERYASKDAGNRLWWHAERRRLDADALRDALLAASAQLDLDRVGGPSFSPDISADALEGLSMKAQAWKPSPPEEQRRRSLYTYTKRSLLPPLATVFDFPDTTLPCGQRDVSLVAPQALALLNNAFVHAQSTALAQRVRAHAPNASPDAHIRAAWQFTLGRSPTAAERRLARRHLAAQEQRFHASRPAPEATPAQSAPEELALASLCHVLLNANEFLFVD
ncbi:MAG: DUF1553 domain-containing protein, partial [Verrucomicrobiales bacterium]|nr:DUF1553 domain-containing protein [Verrucomicrobiales bacterium]